MNINERIKQLRKEVGLNQRQFASKLGLTQSGVSYMEQSGSTVADSTIKTICSILNLNENWLRNGIGPMKLEPKGFSLDDFIDERKGTDLEKEIVRTYFELDPDIRKILLEHLKNNLSLSENKNDDLVASLPNTKQEFEKENPPIDLLKEDLG